MLVCHCHRVTERTIRDLVKAGCRNATAVGNACGAGTGCGGCTELVEELVNDADARPASSASVHLRVLAEAAINVG